MKFPPTCGGSDICVFWGGSTELQFGSKQQFGSKDMANLVGGSSVVDVLLGWVDVPGKHPYLHHIIFTG